MKTDEFTGFLEEHAREYEWAEGEHEGVSGIYVKNKLYDTETHFGTSVIRKNELKALLTHTHQGRNVENITRVTGFFSKVSAWNKGKIGELADRYRNTDM